MKHIGMLLHQSDCSGK